MSTNLDNISSSFGKQTARGVGRSRSVDDENGCAARCGRSRPFEKGCDENFSALPVLVLKRQKAPGAAGGLSFSRGGLPGGVPVGKGGALPLFPWFFFVQRFALLFQTARRCLASSAAFEKGWRNFFCAPRCAFLTVLKLAVVQLGVEAALLPAAPHGLPCSTMCPSRMTRMLSASRMVDSRWATIKLVRPSHHAVGRPSGCGSPCGCRWRRWPRPGSAWAAGSSITRAMHSSCFWPWEMLPPSSPITVS